MANVTSGYALTIAGCPYFFTTEGCVAPSTIASDSDWPDYGRDTSTFPACKGITGMLVNPDFQWSERMVPADGTLEVDGITFKLFDTPWTGTVQATGSVVTGETYYLGTYTGSIGTDLFGKQPRRNKSSKLRTNFLVTSTTFDYVGTSLGTAPKLIWLGEECCWMTVNSAGTATVDASGRAMFDSTPKDIKPIPTESYYPEAFPFFFSALKRKVILWRIDGESYKKLWYGVIDQSPKLDASLAVWELPCIHMWDVLKQKNLSFIEDTNTYKLDGYNAGILGLGVKANRADIETATVISPARYNSHVTYPTFRQLMDERILWYSQLVTASPALTSYAPDEESTMLGWDRDNRLSFRPRVKQNATYVTSINALADLFGERLVGPSEDDIPSRGITWCTSHVLLPVIPKVAYGLYNRRNIALMFPAAESQKFHDRYLDDANPTAIPAFAVSEYGSGDSVSRRQLVLHYTDEKAGYRAIIEPEVDQQTNGGWYSAVGHSLWGVSLIKPLTIDYTKSYAFIKEPAEFKAAYRYVANHFLAAFKHILSDTNLLTAWDVSNLDTLILNNQNRLYGIDYLVSEKQTVEELFTRFLQLSQICPRINSSGILSFVNVRKPSYFDSTATVIAKEQLLDVPAYEYKDALINEVSFKSDTTKTDIVFRDRHSDIRYGAGIKTEFEFKDQNFDFQVSANFTSLRNLVQSFFDLWAYPSNMIRLKLTLQNAYTVGDYVTLNEYALPNNLAATFVQRGGTRTGMILEKTVNLAQGYQELGIIVWEQGTFSGYAPCGRVSEIDTVNKKLTIAKDYIQAARDYSDGENGLDYGGAEHFKTGMKCKLVLRNTETWTAFAVTIAEEYVPVSHEYLVVDETITTSPVDWVTEATNGNVDLIFDAYGTSGITAEQKTYAWVGSTDGGIGTSTDPVTQYL